MVEIPSSISVCHMKLARFNFRVILPAKSRVGVQASPTLGLPLCKCARPGAAPSVLWDRLTLFPPVRAHAITSVLPRGSPLLPLPAQQPPSLSPAGSFPCSPEPGRGRGHSAEHPGPAPPRRAPPPAVAPPPPSLQCAPRLLQKPGEVDSALRTPLPAALRPKRRGPVRKKPGPAPGGESAPRGSGRGGFSGSGLPLLRYSGVRPRR